MVFGPLILPCHRVTFGWPAKTARTILGAAMRILFPPAVGLLFAVVTTAVHAGDTDLHQRLADLRDLSPPIRRQAAEALGQLGPQAPAVAVDALGAMLADPDETVRHEAALALANVGTSAVPALARAMRSDRNKAQVLAAVVLRFLGPQAKASVPDLAVALDSSDATVRLRAAGALQGIGPAAKAATPALLAACKDPANLKPLPASEWGRSVCEAVIKALRAIDPPALEDAGKIIVPMLMTALTGDEAASDAASVALHELGPAAKAALPKLAKLYREDKGRAGIGAGWALMGMKQDGFRVLMEVAKDDKVEVPIREGAIFGLLNTAPGNEVLVKAAKEFLSDDKPAIRRKAIEVLGRVGPPAKDAVPDLAAALGNEAVLELAAADPQRSFPVARALVAIGGDDVGPALVKALASDKLLVRWEAVMGLAFMGRKAKPAEDELHKTMKDKYAAVVIASAFALIRSGADPQKPLDVLDKGLHHTLTSVRLKAIEAVGQLGPRAASLAQWVERILAHKELGPAALEALVKLGPEGKRAVPKLVTQLKAEDPATRIAALRMLGTMGSVAKDAVPAIVTALGDKNDEARSEAFWALTRVGAEAKPAVPELIALAKASGAHRWMAVEVLGKIGSDAKEAVPVLVPLLGSDKHLERLHAAQALGRIGPAAKDAVPALRPLLHDPERGVRAWAAFALVRVAGDKDALTMLAAIYKNHKIDVQVTAGPAEAIRALHALGADARDALPVLIEATKSKTLTIATEAIEALGAIDRPKQTLPVLTVLLDHPDPFARAMAARALGELGPAAAKAVPRLTALLEDVDQVADAAEEALARIQPKKNVP
jgi:HEAT repeat protein